MVMRAEAISRFLRAKAPPDLADLYSIEMECQVNVGQDGGDRIDGEFKGRRWHGWTDGLTTWKSFRIPYKAGSSPYYDDKEVKFDLAQHAEGIGMTGWNWKKKVSQWVAYDFDAILGHSEKHTAKLTNQELKAVEDAACAIDWVTVRKSSSGKGLHLYVFLDDVPTDNHNEHAALARAILGKMSALAGFDFMSKVDICGGNMWVWHRKSVGNDGFEMVKQGILLGSIPPNWRDHVAVVNKTRRKNLPQDIGDPLNFDELSGQRSIAPLDEGHQQLIAYLKDQDALWWWDQDHHMLVTHTIHLQEAYKALGMKGYFKTMSEGRERGVDHNCFAFPLRKGAWTVRRYHLGVQEHTSWEQDGSGWTRAYLNRECDIRTAARAFDGLEDPSGGFIFRTAEAAQATAQLLGVYFDVGKAQESRRCHLKQHKDGRLIIEIEYDENDRADEMRGWLAKKKKWIKIFRTNAGSAVKDNEAANCDDLLRHLVTERDEDYGWVIKSDGRWRVEPLSHVRVALASQGLSNKELNDTLGSSIFKCWRLVNKPFEPEYPGDREWNRNAAQFRFAPTMDTDNLKYPTWTAILEHCGFGLNEALKDSPWAKANGIITGGDYLKCFIASLFQHPTDPLPYIFFYGPQNSGKSIFHEALSLLVTRGYHRADVALSSQAGFNAELEGAIMCVIEETDLHKNKLAYNRIKDWVTSRDILIHRKGKTPYHIPNTTHWIQCANDHRSCPVFAGDTRITMCYVDSLDPFKLIPKKLLIPMLEKEAADFLGAITTLEIPESPDRLNIPVIGTHDKEMVQTINLSPLEAFISERCHAVSGAKIKFSDFYMKYAQWCESEGEGVWSKIKVGKEIPPKFPKARFRKDGQVYLGNLYWRGQVPEEACVGKYIVRENYLDTVLTE